MEEIKTETNSVNETEPVVDNQVEETDFDEYEDLDEGTEEKKEEKPQKQKMSRKEAKEQAQKRREREAKENYKKGVLDTIGGINSFTQEKIEDDYDFEVYQTMVEMEKKGYDPLTDYHKYVAMKKREEAKQLELQEQEKNKQKETISNDIAEFQKSNPNVDLKELMENNEIFKILSEGKLGSISLNAIYEQNVKIENIIKARVEDALLEQEARKNSSPGGLSGEQGEFKAVDYKTMPTEEFKKVLEKVKSGSFVK